MHQFDILIIGTGVSGMVSLKSILTEVLQTEAHEPLAIAVLEQQSSFWNGVAFGSKSSVNGLIITTVAEFISDDYERQAFLNWLNVNRKNIIENYLNKGGAAAQQWVSKHCHLFEAGEWDTLYIPRYWYSDYLAASLKQLIQKAEQSHKAKITRIQGEAVRVSRSATGNYIITSETPSKHQQPLTCRNLILAIGSPPSKVLPNVDVDERFLYIKNIYSGCINSIISSLAAKLQSVSKTGKHQVLITGSNACCTELLYLFSHHAQLYQLIDKVTILSPSGALPSAITTVTVPAGFEQLNKLSRQLSFTYTQLIAATVADLKVINHYGVNTVAVAQLVKRAMNLQRRLPAHDQEFCRAEFGLAVSGNIRRMGNDYHEAISRMLGENKLTAIKGKFNSLKSIAEGSSAIMGYVNNEDELIVHKTPFSAVINCTGFQNLTDCSSKLINNLIETGLCRVNASGRGFEINEKFEAAENLYVMGPLLASNNNKNIHFWHVENVSRILQLAPVMTGYVLQGNKKLLAAEELKGHVA
jgi:uncharacterized NAD(P)/FAD-binding protein YdhS